MTKISILALCVVFIGGVSAYAINQHGTYSWRYKITVTVETPEGLKTGSAVREISNSVPIIRLPDVGNPGSIKGEAVVVDLGERGVVFSLISHESDNRFSATFPLPGRKGGQGSTTAEGIKYHASLPVGTKKVVDPVYPPSYPKIVTFTDRNDPKSVTLVQEWERERKTGLYKLKTDRFAELFGEGVRLRDITLEITDEPVTWGHVDEWLSWLSEVKVGYLNGATIRSSNELSNVLHFGNFKRGEQ